MKTACLPIASFCQTGTGGTPLRSESDRYYGGDIPWIKSGELKENVITSAEESITEAALRETSVKIVPAGAILIAMYGATVGRVAKLGIPATTNQAVCHVIPDENIADVQYLYHCLRSKLPEFLHRRMGGAQPNISQGIIRETMIPLPSLSEQRRIAAILDTADRMRELRRQSIAKYDTLLKAVFLEMFGNPVKNPKGWPFVSISSFVDAFQGGKSIQSDSNESPQSVYRVLKVSAVTSMSYKLEESKPMPGDYVPSSEHIVRSGDLLFSRANTTELVGAVAYVWDTPENILLSDKLWRFVWSKSQSVAPLFIWSLFQISSFRHELGKLATGTSGSMKNISQEKLLAMKVPLPELKLQEQFASVVKSVQRVQKLHAESNLRMDNLFHGLQQRAFSGRLFTEKAAAAAQQELFAG